MSNCTDISVIPFDAPDTTAAIYDAAYVATLNDARIFDPVEKREIKAVAIRDAKVIGRKIAKSRARERVALLKASRGLA